MSKFIVMDIVFYANSLNYDQGSGNIQELKKITKWDGKQYTLVSRYALRYSMLHHAHSIFGSNWPLATNPELNNKQGVVQVKGDATNLIKNYPEFDLFGYMMTEEKEAANTRPAVAALSHAISLVPFNYDSHFNANLDVAKRSGHPTSINPFTIEEHYSYYVYSIVVDLERVGRPDGKEGDVLETDKKAERISQLFEAVSTLKRQIKGRQEDISPKIMMVGLYDRSYESFKDRIGLSDTYEEEVTERKESVENGTKIVRRTVKTSKPQFEIYGMSKKDSQTKESIKMAIKNFVGSDAKQNSMLFYKSPEVNVEFKND